MNEEKWENLASYLSGGQIPRNIYSGVVHNKFVVTDGLIQYIREEKNGGWIYALVIPDELKFEAIKLAHKLVGPIGQLKTVKALFTPGDF